MVIQWGKMWSRQHCGLYFHRQIFTVTALWNVCGNTSFLFPISIWRTQRTSDTADGGGDVITFETWAMCVWLHMHMKALQHVCTCIRKREGESLYLLLWLCVFLCVSKCVYLIHFSLCSLLSISFFPFPYFFLSFTLSFSSFLPSYHPFHLFFLPWYSPLFFPPNFCTLNAILSFLCPSYFSYFPPSPFSLLSSSFFSDFCTFLPSYPRAKLNFSSQWLLSLELLLKLLMPDFYW